MASSLLSLAHRAAWQRLPRSLRRSIAFSLADLLMPSISAGHLGEGPVIVVGALRTASGLGQSARLCHDALQMLGFPVFGIDIGPALMQPSGVDFKWVDGRGITEPAILIIHASGPTMPLAMLRVPRKLIRQSRIIGYWAWELPKVPRDWLRGTRFVHEIWAPSTFTAQGLREIAPHIPMRVVPHPVGIRPVRQRGRERNPKKPFLVLSMFDMGSSMMRKNPLGAIAAFKAAFGDDPGARLVIKGSNLNVFPSGARQLRALCPEGGNVILLEALRDRAGLEALYGEVDAVISLHRSEGFGLVIAEAMLHGVPVIATGWSGNVDFLSGSTGISVGYDLVPAIDPQDTYDLAEAVWAEPRIEEAAQALRFLRYDHARAWELGNKAAEFAAAAFGSASYRKAIGWQNSAISPPSGQLQDLRPAMPLLLRTTPEDRKLVGSFKRD